MGAAKGKLQKMQADAVKHDSAEKMERLQAKTKLEQAKAELKLAKKEEARSDRRERQHTRQAKRAIRTSLRRKVATKPGAPVDQGAITAARKATFALKQLDIAKTESRARHKAVVNALREFVKNKIEHRFIRLKHKTRKAAHEKAVMQAKKDASKRAKKSLRQAKRRARTKERR